MKKVHRLISCSAVSLMVLNLLPNAAVLANTEAVLPQESQNETQADSAKVNIALHKPVLASAGNGSRAVDGDIESYWDGGPAPSELFVDLQGYYDVSQIQVIPYYAGSRYYHYEVYVSSDGSVYEKVGEKTDDKAQTANGETYDMSKEGVRYVRVKMTYNSSNPSVHINELRVFGTENPDFVKPDTPTTDPNDAANIAFGKPTRSTTNTGFSGLVNDGDRDTAWSGEDYPKYVDIDLLDNYDLDSIRVFMPEDAEYAYTVYGSVDGTHFDRLAQTGKKVSSHDGDEIVFDTPVTARVLRVSCMANSKGEGANSRISEVKAYGTLSETPKVETRTDLNLESYEDWMKRNYDVDINSLKDENGDYDINDTFTDADVYAEVNDLIARVLGEEYLSWFELELAPLEDRDADYFELSMNNGKVHIKGNEGLSLTSGLNHYLKYYCNVHVSQLTMQTTMPEAIVPIEGTIRKDSPYEVRYAYNYCTLSYSMPFWGYDEWQREMDWFALNGVNLILDLTGTEALYVEYLQNFGYDIDDAKAFVCGPSYKAWWLMGNLEGYGGPVSDEWIKDTVQMARVNQRRMHVLGMQPCLQGFMGAMPENFGSKAKQVLMDKGYDDISEYMVEQGDWSGFTRPPILKTTYNGWQELADTFYDTQEMIYGQATKYYAGDLAHEGGIIPPDLSKPEMSATILNKMIEYDKDAVWVIQSWLSNPNAEILEGFGDNKEEHVIVLDLDSTENPHWSNTTNWNGKEFGGTGWVFCMLDNYGGRTGMHGELEYLANAITHANANSEHMKGIGITPEGTLNNPVNYDLFWEMAWETEPMDLDTWLDNYVTRRYGSYSENAREAWEILLNTAYSYNKEDGTYKYHIGNPNCITNMRPSFDPEIVIGDYHFDYDAAAFEKVMDLMMKDFDQFKDNECYVYDMVDILRQTVANSQNEFFYRIREAYETRNMELFTKYKEKMLNSILVLDELAGFEKNSLYGTWISKATNFYNDPRNSEYDDYMKDLMVINSKMICSVWSSKTLQTYGHRQYAGMERDYNYPMWSLWLDRVETAISTGSYVQPSTGVEYFNIGWDMVINGKEYETEAASVDGTEDHRSMTEIWQDIKANYLTVDARKDQVIDENIAGDATAYAGSSLGSYTADKLNDGNSGSLWINGTNQVPAYCGLTFSSKKQIYGVTLVFEPRNPLGANVMDVQLLAKQDDGTYAQVWSGQTYDAEKQSYTIDVALDETITTSDLRLNFTTNGGIYPACGEIKVYASTGIKLMDGTDMFVSDGTLCGIPDGWTVAQLKEWLKTGGGQMVFKNGETVLGDEDVITEGCTLDLINGNNVLDHLDLSMASALTTRLESLIADCQAIDVAQCSTQSYKLLETRITEAQTLLESSDPKPSALRQAYDALNRAKAQLVSIAGYYETLAALEAEPTDYLTTSNKTAFEANLAAAKAAADTLKEQDAATIYAAKANLENAANLLLPADNSNIASKGTIYADNSLSSYYGPAKMVNGNYDDCWVANSQKVFPVKAGVTFAEGQAVDGMKVVFEQNGYRNTRIGFQALVQTEDGSWITVGEGECGSKNGYTFNYDLSDLDGKVVDARVVLTSWATDDGSPYPGVAELELYAKTDKADLQAKVDSIGTASFEDEAAAAALKKARYALGRNTVSQNFVNEAAAALDEAVVPAWKASIRNQIAAIDPSKYSEESAAVWKAESEAILAALDEAADFSALAALQSRLDTALGQLSVRTSKILLNQAIAVAQSLKEDGALEGVNSLVVKRFEAALSEAIRVRDDAAATQDAINSAWMELCEAVQMLSFKTDKTELAALVALYDAIDLSEYAADGQEEFLAALAQAHEVLDDEAVLTEGSIAAAIARLTEAKNNLVKVVSVDTALLEFLVAESDKLDLSMYVEAGKAEFTAALAHGKEVLASPESQQAVDEAVSTLSDAYLNLRLKADESLLARLSEIAAQLDAVDLSAYSEAAAAQILEARTAIREAQSKPELTKDEAELLIAKGEAALETVRTGKVTTVNKADVPAADQKTSAKPNASASVKTGVFTAGWTAALGAAAAMMEVLRRRNRK